MEDTTAEFLWKWEARDMKSVRKGPLRQKATAARKRLYEVLPVVGYKQEWANVMALCFGIPD